jgi:Domain of unknown function (DUF1843)
MPSKKTQAGSKAASRKQSSPAGTGRAAAAGPLPPYGVAIRDAISRGDTREMRRVAASARKWVKDVQAALDRMEKSLSDLEG